MIPVFVIVRDRLQCLRALIAWLELAEGAGPIVLVDHESGYPPLLAYLDDQSHRLVRTANEVGGIWHKVGAMMNGYPDARYYVVTDPDIVPRAECPRDALRVMVRALESFPLARCAGFGLELAGLPAHYRLRERVVFGEAAYWVRRLGSGAYAASVDSTFAVYDRCRPRAEGYPPFNAVRMDYPYVAYHTSWYLDMSALPDDERWYVTHASFIGTAYRPDAYPPKPERQGWMSQDEWMRYLRIVANPSSLHCDV